MKGLELGRQVALENIDTEKFSEISTEAQKQVDFINGSIENLRLSFQLTDDPAEQQQILDAIKVLTRSRFQILRDELEAIRETLKPEDFQQALRGINLGEQLALENLDTEKFAGISADAQRQVDLINGNIENLRLSLQLTDDLTEQQDILTAIKVLTGARFAVLREELIKIKDSLDPEVFNQALRGLNLGEQLAIQNLGTEKFSLISAEAQKQADFISGSIDNLRLSLQLTDDPAEVQQILNAIKILTAARFDVLIQGLKDIRDSFDDAAVFDQALKGLTLGKQVALRGIDTEGIGVTLSGIGEQISDTDFEITQLFNELGEQTTAVGVNEAIGRLRTAITTKYQLMRDKINESADTEEEKAKQIVGVDFQEGQALDELGSRSLGQFRSLIDTAQFLLDNATADNFQQRRENLITAINNFYDARIRFINNQDLSDTDRVNMQAVADIQRNIALDAVPQMHASVTERLRLEQDLQNKIQDLRDQETENEADRLEDIATLHERHNDRLLDLEERFLEDFDDLRTRRTQSAQDALIEYERDLEDLQTRFARQLFGDSVVSFGDLTAEQQQQLQQDTGFERGLFDLNQDRDRDRFDLQQDFGGLRPGSAGYEFYRQQIEAGDLTDTNLIEQLFGRRGLDEFTELSRGKEDAGEDLAAGIVNVNQEAAEVGAALREELSPLLEEQRGLVATQTTTAALESQTATTASETEVTKATTAMTEADTAVANAGIAGEFAPAVETFGTASETLHQAAMELAEVDIGRIAEEVARIPNALEGFGQHIVGLTETLNTLPDVVSNAVAEGFSALGMLLDDLITPMPEITINAGVVYLNGEISRLSTSVQPGGGTGVGGERPINVTVTPQPVMLDGKVVAEVVNENTVLLEQEGGTL